ncbi:molybdopterin-binding protein [Acuticoccus mangrovi]|uniref:Molybdopterin-binding protein n=1 Tax=Acuticoccus mangrovi TaxID=2796142 RepID=A0A934MGS7_9HYPH|nr:molybdopterin-binding protein [Acuticoccus mangrovi]MBJ3775316.1 molybdopterin-binding protein [Acuticoccus mangrovi]
MSNPLTRRRFLIGGALGAGALAAGGYAALGRGADVDAVLQSAEWVTMDAQRALLWRGSLAREFSEADISPTFRVNGTQAPDSAAYAALHRSGFADWKLKIGGLVDRSLELSLADLRALPSRTQITRHDCVEGWSAIGKWTGVPLGHVLQMAGLKPNARFAVFHCADELERTFDGSGRYYESIDLIDAFHPQTILAYAMNDAALTVGHGAPLRLRVERQLGYKHAKYVMQIDVVDGFENLWGGRGGFWEDRGYQWYAGI